MGRKVKDNPNRDAIKAAFLANLAEISTPWEPAGLALIDRIIDPRHSRTELIQTLKIAKGRTGGRSKRLMASWNKM